MASRLPHVTLIGSFDKLGAKSLLTREPLGLGVQALKDEKTVNVHRRKDFVLIIRYHLLKRGLGVPLLDSLSISYRLSLGISNHSENF